MKKLSERMIGAADNLHAGMPFNENNLAAFAHEVAQLEKEKGNYYKALDEIRDIGDSPGDWSSKDAEIMFSIVVEALEAGGEPWDKDVVGDEEWY